jgi:hypothetical protein
MTEYKKNLEEKERDFLQVTPMGDMLLIYLESKDNQKTFRVFAESKDHIRHVEY